MLGSQGAFGSIDVPQYRERRCKRKRAALTDESFVDEICYASWWHGNAAPNGVIIDYHKDVVESMLSHIVETSGTGSNVLIILMTPDATVLI